ncbi:MAG TPA: Hint domain-containing protein [Rhodospirillales bacterium]|nr:Hint domain-containing protein [Rhodospirillales bacterium]
MATQETFSNYYLLTGSGSYSITGNSTYTATGGSFTINDNQDASADGLTNPGDNLQFFSNYTGSNVTGTLVGTTPNGVVVSRGGYNYLFTNSTYSLNQSGISPNTSDPYNYCFLEGTSINTPEGTRPVESIEMGDKVLSADGRELTVRWMGHETVRNGIGASIHKAPIKISAGAFGDGLPVSDLYVSNAHAFLLDGHLVVASALINGEIITAVPFSEMPSEFTYWHIETEEHELVVANGVAAETLSGAPERKDFDNYDSYVAQYGADRIIQPMAYPRIKDVAQMPESLVERFNLEKPALNWDELLDADGAEVVLKQANS